MTKKILIVGSLLIAIWLLTCYAAALFLSRDNKLVIPELPFIANKKVETITLKTTDNLSISAWFVDNKSEKAIILLSGIRGNKQGQIKKAKFFLAKGYSVLMPDLRATGQSDGEIISFGWHEKKDVLACIAYLKKKNIASIAAIGHSLGAASIVYTSTEFSDFEFIILESCYDNIRNAFNNRIEKFSLPFVFFEPIQYFMKKRLQVNMSELAPDSLIKNITCPVLILAGDSESQIRLEETQQIFENCGATNKRLHIFTGGKHEDFYSRFPEEYEKQLTGFLEEIVSTKN